MTVAEILAAFPKYSALIVGDICLDRWCTYDPGTAEPSRETGIPRIGVVSTEITPGAGGTVANNLAALGIGRVAVLGIVGDDGFGYELKKALSGRGISPELLVASPDVPTFTYTKLINISTGEEDQARIDFIHPRALASDLEAEILERLRAFATAFDIILVSDQAETRRGGVITPAVRQALAEIAHADPEKIIWADSRIRTEQFRGIILKPNDLEADSACASLFGSIDYERLRRHIGSKPLFVTKGPDGVLVVDDQGETLVPTLPIAKPVDICGAGDSFSAGAAVALAITRSPIEAAHFGNKVASITIMKKGTGTASPSEVLA